MSPALAGALTQSHTSTSTLSAGEHPSACCLSRTDVNISCQLLRVVILQPAHFSTTAAVSMCVNDATMKSIAWTVYTIIALTL